MNTNRATSRPAAQVPCVYCGVRPGNTRAHVPPRCLFPKPRPLNLVTVPCCEPCRQTQTLDDEYFRNMLAMRVEVTSNPAAQQALKTVYRALARPRGWRTFHALVRSMRGIELRLPSGLYIGEATACDADLQRLDGVIHRMMLGLYWHEFDERLPHSHVTRVYSADGIPAADRVNTEMFATLFKQALGGSRRIIGHDVFAYCCVEACPRHGGQRLSCPCGDGPAPKRACATRHGPRRTVVPTAVPGTIPWEDDAA